jgi:predicted metal-binding protein
VRCVVSWTGCPGELACLHYLDEHPHRVTALCKACARALTKCGGWRKVTKKKRHRSAWVPL